MNGALVPFLSQDEARNASGILAGTFSKPQGLTVDDFYQPIQSDTSHYNQAVEEARSLSFGDKLLRGISMGFGAGDPMSERFEAAKQMDAIARQNAQARQQAKNNLHNYTLNQEKFEHQRTNDDRNYDVRKTQAENDSKQLSATLNHQAAQRQQWGVSNKMQQDQFMAQQNRPETPIYDVVDGKMVVKGHTTVAGDQVFYDQPSQDKTTISQNSPDKSIQEKYATKVTAAEQWLRNLNEYEKLIAKNGTEAFGATSGRMQAILTELQNNYKDMKNLGQLTAGDMDMINRIIPDMTSVSSYYHSNDTALAKIQEARKFAINEIRLFEKNNSGKIQPIQIELGANNTPNSGVDLQTPPWQK